MIRPLVLSALMLMPCAALAQDKAQTLADIRVELGTLAAEFNALKSELVTTGAASNGSAGGSALQRLDTIEAALSRLTAKTEEVELKLNRVVSDGTNRIGDIEFRLCEVTEGCDLAALPDTPTLAAVVRLRPRSPPRQTQPPPRAARNWPLANRQTLTGPRGCSLR